MRGWGAVERVASSVTLFRPFGASAISRCISTGAGPTAGGKQGGRYFLTSVSSSSDASRGCADGVGAWEIYWEGRQIVWSGAGVVHQRYTLESEVAQVVLCCFEGSTRGGDGLTVVALHKASLSLCCTDGSISTLSLPENYCKLWPLPNGLILDGATDAPPCLLLHPLKELEELIMLDANGRPRTGSCTRERIVWASRECALLLSWSPSARRHALWRTARVELAAAVKPPLLPTTDAVDATTASIMAGALSPLTPGHPLLNTAAPPPSISAAPRRTAAAAIRTADGKLSPAVFSANPRSAAGSAPPTPPLFPSPSPVQRTPPRMVASASSQLTTLTTASSDGAPKDGMPQHSEMISCIALLWEESHGSATSPATHALLSTAETGQPILAALRPDAQQLSCFVLAPDSVTFPPAVRAEPSAAAAGDTPPVVTATYDIPAVDAIAVRSTRHSANTLSAPPCGPPATPLDLLVLQPDGRLGLYIGSNRICDVALPMPSEQRRDRSTSWSGSEEAIGAQALPREQATPGGQPMSDMDDSMSMGTATPASETRPVQGRQEFNPWRNTPSAAQTMDIDTTGAGTVEVSRFRCAVGSRVVFDTTSGVTLEAGLQFGPLSPLASTVLAALQSALKADAANAITAGALMTDGFGSGIADTEWGALKGVVDSWASDPSKFASRPSTEAVTDCRSVGASAPSAWEMLLRSRQHAATLASGRFSQWMGAVVSGVDSAAAGADGAGSRAAEIFSPPSTPQLSLSASASPASMPQVWDALEAVHAVYEDLKMNQLTWGQLTMAGELAASLAARAGAVEFLDHYARDLSPKWVAEALSHTDVFQNAQPRPRQHDDPRRRPADLHQALSVWITGGDGTPWLPRHVASLAGSCQPPHLPAFQRSVALVHSYRALARCTAACRTALRSAEHERAPGVLRRSVIKGAREVVLSLAAFHWSPATLETLPPGVALPLQEAIQRCRRQPPANWPIRAYVLLGREDLVANVRLQSESDGGNTPTNDGGGSDEIGAPYLQRLALAQPDGRKGTGWNGGVKGSGEGGSFGGADAETEGSSATDGMEFIHQADAGLRFGADLRLLEVRRLLSSAQPVVVHVANTPDAADPELTQAHQVRLTNLAVRTMGLSVGRGAFALGTLRLLPTDPFSIPPLCMAGRLPEKYNATINLDLSAAAPAGGACTDITAWPEFHNGVAAGLRMAPGGTRLTRTWIVYNRPAQPNYTHAGMLMALGLTGNLASLSGADLFTYLSQGHDATMIGVLLGMAAAHRGTMDSTTNRMLFLHLPSRHPSTFPELELSPLVQAAALLGVGLLYQGSCHRLVAEIMLQEIGRRAGQSGSGQNAAGVCAASHDREGYALAAGMALGLITLGKGDLALGLTDLQIEDRLRYFMCGPSDPGLMGTGAPSRGSTGPTGRPSSSAIGVDGGAAPGGAVQGDDDDGNGASHTVLEGRLVNLDVTSPAATVALTLMYLKTNNSAVAARFTIPDTHFALDYVRPDFLMQRMLGRSLIMWDAIQPTQEWVDEQLPPLIRGPLSDIMALSQAEDFDPNQIDIEALAQAHCNAVAGALLAIGMRFAGSANRSAQELLQQYCLYFLKAKGKAPDVAAGAAAAIGTIDKQGLESCLSLAALGLSLVMAGTGHLTTLKLLRGLRKRLSPVSTQSAAMSGIPNAAFSGISGLTYGNHMAVSMSIGFLFLGGGAYTFATNNAAIAALLVSLFPRFPQTPTENRCHLQAFRHLYVIAAEPRCVTAIDIDTRSPVYVPLEVQLRPPSPALPPPPPFTWTAPCLLPERQAVDSVRIGGPRYWAQKVQGKQLSALYQHRTLFVKRKAGALPYADDANGVRSLLSRFFSHSAGPVSTPGGPSPARTDGSAIDLIHLCSTFSASPFVMAFAHRVCADASAAGVGGATALSAEFQSFCRAVLYECVTLEKPHMLLPYLTLYNWQQELLAAEGSGLRALGGGADATLAVQSLKMVRGYYHSAAAEATAAVAKGAADIAADGGDGGLQSELWEPLLQVPFVEGLWQQLGQRWQRFAFCQPPSAQLSTGEASSGTSTSLLSSYIAAGGFPLPQLAKEPPWRQQLFGSFLAAYDVPNGMSLRQACRSLKAANAVASNRAPTLPEVSEQLDDAPPHAVLMVASNIPSTEE